MEWLSLGSAVFSEADEEVRGCQVTPLRLPLPEKVTAISKMAVWPFNLAGV